MQDLWAKRLIWLEIQDSMGFRRFTRGRLHGRRRKRADQKPGKTDILVSFVSAQCAVGENLDFVL